MQTNLKLPLFAPFSLVLAGLLLLSTGCTPSGPKALLQGEELIRKGKYEAAIEKLELAVNLLPNEARAWNYLGVARNRAGQYADARLAYERALQLDRDLAAARFNLGKMYLEQGVPISALEQLSTFVMLDQKSVEGWLLIGDANLELLRYERALENYWSALRLQRDVPRAYNGIGMIYMNRNDPRNAYKFFMEALKHDANYTPAILNLAVVLHTKLDAKKIALARYREYLGKAPGASNADAIKGVVRRLDLELNPRLVEEPPVQIAMVDTNKTQIKSIVEEPASETVETEKLETVIAPAKVVTNRTTGSVETAKRGEIKKIATEKKTEVVKIPATPKTNRVENVIVAEEKAVQPKPPVKKVASPSEEPKPEVVEKKTAPEPEKTVMAKQEPAKPEPVPVVEAPEEPVEEEEPLDVVQLEVEDISPPQDIPIPQETPSEPPFVANAEPEPQLPVAPNSVNANLSPAEKAETEKKRGFFQKINPANLFRGDEDENKPVRSETIVTPLPPSDSSPPAQASAPTASTPRRVASAVEFAGVTPMQASTGPRRYNYRQAGPPSPGDRAASERLFQRGLDAQAQLNPGRAASYFNSAAMADPSYFPAQYNLGLLSYQTGQTMKSLSAFEAALALDPDSAEARYNFSLALQKTKYPLDAIQELTKLLGNYPDNLRAHLLLGNVYAQDLDDIDRARIEYQKVLELDSDHAQAPAIRAWVNEHP